MTFRKCTFSLAVFLIACVPRALAQGTWTRVAYPGAYGNTTAFGINQAGDVVGYYETIDGNFHGFLLSGGVYTTIDCPGAQSTYALRINMDKQIVGECGYLSSGFSYNSQTGVFTIFNYPGATWTEPFAINDAGVIAGTTEIANVVYGFELLTSGKGTLISPPGATTTAAVGITAAGEIVGTCCPMTNGFVNFSFLRGHYNQLIIPVSTAAVLGVNPAGTAVVGQYDMPGGEAGFIFQDGILTTLQFPGAHDTGAYGINASGVVVGVSSKGGFTWTPRAAEAKK